MLHNPYAGEVPFPECGEGTDSFVIRYRTKDLATLRGKYGFKFDSRPEYDGQGRLREHFWEILFLGLLTHDPPIYVDLLKAGLKRAGRPKPVDPLKEEIFDPDDLPWPFERLREMLETGLLMARWGITADQAAEMLRKQVEEMTGMGGPEDPGPLPQGPMTESQNSSESSAQATETGSESTNAGMQPP